MFNGIEKIVGAVSTAACSDSRLRKPSPEVGTDDYDCCDAPTLEEVQAASKELENTMMNLDGNAGQPEPAVVVIAEATGTTDTSEEKKMEEKSTNQLAVCSKAAAANPVVLSQSGGGVVQCVDMFQRDPQVQAAVMSLARDPAIWDAFVRNEKVQELLRGGRSSPLNGTVPGSSLDLLRHHTNPFIVAVHCLKSTVWEVLDSVVDVVHGIFGFFDRKLFGGRESEPLDRPLKACMVLTILLFSLVLLKRGSHATSAGRF